MKKSLIISLLFIFIAGSIFPQDYSDRLQDLRDKYQETTNKLTQQTISNVAALALAIVGLIIWPEEFDENIPLSLIAMTAALGGTVWALISQPQVFMLIDKQKQLDGALDYVVNHPSITSRDLDAITNGTIYIGMPEAVLIASWGSPKRINKSVGSWGTHKQYVYGDYGSYVYVENGYITSWQD